MAVCTVPMGSLALREDWRLPIEYSTATRLIGFYAVVLWEESGPNNVMKRTTDLESLYYPSARRLYIPVVDMLHNILPKLSDNSNTVITHSFLTAK